MNRPPPLPNVRALAPGDVAPRWRFVDRGGRTLDLLQDWIAGHWLVLCLHPGTEVAPAVLQAHAAALQAQGAHFFAIGDEAAATAPGVPADVPLLVDHEDAMSRQLGLQPPRPLTIVLRPDGHFAQFFDGPLERQLQAARGLVERVLADSPTLEMTVRHPPVLLIPEVFSRTECRTLIDIFHTQGQTYLQKEQALDYLGADYKMRVPEHMREDRVDHFFFHPPTLEFLAHRLNRVFPEIAKAFQYQITQYESLRMACYQGSRGGYGHGHRDNVPPTTYRRFAMSINLNTEDFDGGELRFPEFGDIRYRPASGTAIVFSSSLLHEALQVTRGQRYVFLAFLFGDR